MKIELESALRYPFRKRGWINLIFHPGLNLLWVNLLFYGGLGILFLGNGGTHSLVPREDLFNGQAVLQKMQWMFVLSSVLLPPLLMLVGAAAFGFYWHLIARLQTAGYEAEPPSWSGQGLQFWKDGIQLAVYLWVVCSPLLLVSFITNFWLPSGGKDVAQMASQVFWLNGLSFFIQIVWFFLIPFFMVPIIASAQSRKASELFDYSRTIRLGKCVYGKGLVALFITVILSMIYLAVGFLGMFVTLGLSIPFCQALYLATACYVWGQAYAELASSGQDSFQSFGRLFAEGGR